MSEVDVKTDVKADRRVFLQTAAKVAGVMTALGLTTELLRETHASGQTQKGAGFFGGKEVKVKLSPQQKAIGDLFMDLLKNKNATASLAKYQAEARLTPAQINAVKALSTQDLTQLDAIRAKMGAFMDHNGDTTGYFIY